MLRSASVGVCVRAQFVLSFPDIMLSPSTVSSCELPKDYVASFSNEPQIDLQTYSAPASLAANRVYFYFNPRDEKMTISARGINATVMERDIGTINGVIHVIDRVLGVPYQSVYQRISTDPSMRYKH